MLDVLGRKLLSTDVLMHVYAGKKDTYPQQVSFLFDGYMPMRIYGGGNGESLCFSLDDIVGVDLGEYGGQVVFNASGEPCFSKVVGQRLVSVSTVNASAGRELIGLFFSFDNEECLSILNLGDELFVYEKIPEEIVTGEGLSLILLG
ncbi:hypothetical protein [Pseudomonas gingeri]|uniref:hypothetical protein n=1 Tax=Pseudomonas gingeri TaxID=117681 RepID=UPI00210BF327|nr:hypothetical protein [Pseudomonas gingeri]